MLLQLQVRNLATISSLELEFSRGVTMLTGETGAGKSILIDAIQIALGAKVSAEWIRTGSSQAVIIAEFAIQRSAHLRQLLQEKDIEVEEVLLMRRVIKANGRHKNYINDISVSRATMNEVGDQLIHIHGQHDNQSLLRSSTHVDFVDGYGQLFSLREGVQKQFREYTQLQKEYDHLLQQMNERTERIEELTFIKNELQHAELREGELEELQQEYQMLEHIEQLFSTTSSIKTLLYEQDHSIVDSLHTLQSLIQEISRIDPQASAWSELVQTSIVYLEDVLGLVQEYSATLEENPQRMEWVNDRIGFLQGLMRKYQINSISSLLERLEHTQKELYQIENWDQEQEVLQQNLQQSLENLEQLSLQLSEYRSEVAVELDQKITSELHELGMEHAIFKTQIQPFSSTQATLNYRFSALGIDQVEFLLSVNPGQPLRPLQKVASGGELSRIMLAIKTILATVDPTETLIFDEIDSGIGGRIAEILGQKLSHLSNSHQVLCISHLPQIVAYANHHFQVSKHVAHGETYSKVRRLDAPDRIEELARMIGGTEITTKTRKLAAEMLQRCAR